MDQSRIVAAVITSDPATGEAITAAVQESGRIDVGTNITVPYGEISREALARLRDQDPQLIFVDLQEDPPVGIRLVNFLAEGNPNRRFIGIGPVLQTQVLMEAMRAGISEYVPLPLEEGELAGAVERLERKILGAVEGPAKRQPGTVHAIFSPKGGSGSTTVATNLAIYLHQLTGKKTLLVDLDLELGEIAVFLGMQPRFNFVDMIRNFHRMDAELLASYIEKHETGVHLLSAPFHPEKAEVLGGEGVRKILHFLKQHYDYIVVDTSKSFSPATLATFEEADQILLLTNVNLPSLRNIKRCQPLLDRIVGADRDRVKLVVNRFHQNDVITLEEVERTLGMPVYRTLANDYESVIRSINTGQPVMTNEKSPFARDLKAMGSDLVGFVPERNGHHKSGAVWSRLFTRKTSAKS